MYASIIATDCIALHWNECPRPLLMNGSQIFPEIVDHVGQGYEFPPLCN